MPSYPDLSKSKLIGIDTETKDPELSTKGSGAYTNNGRLVGFSLANEQGFAEYYNVGHLGCTEEESTKNLEYLRKVMALPIPKVGTNLKYDIGWIDVWAGIPIAPPYYDITFAEALLDEYCRGKNNLDALAQKYLGESKKNSKLLEYCQKMGWSTTKRKGGREYIWKMPYADVREYAIGDAEQPIKIWLQQEKLLQEQGLTEVYDLEQRLLPLLICMKRNGVRVDESKLLRLGMKLSDEIYRLQNVLNKEVGFDLNVDSSKQLQQVFDKRNWSYPRNPPTEVMKKKGQTLGNPSFDKFALKEMEYLFAEKVLRLRHLKTLMKFFIIPYPKLMTDGVLRADFNQLNADEAGTISGRFSGSKPNLQQVTSKVEEDLELPWLTGQVIRELFIPFENCDWLKIDWAQIEYRFIAHYGIGAGSEKIRQRYNEDPNTDYHSEMMEMTGIENRKDVKGLNFGAAYEMGWRAMAKLFGWPLDYARTVHTMYHNKVPFIKHTSKKVARVAEQRGYIKTILNRRARLRHRDKSYTMFNRLIQGSAADLMKLAMVQAWEEGLFEVLIPHLTVHDEIDCSVPRTQEGRAAALRLKEIMETCLKLRVPILADAEIGENWGKLQPFQ
jgi:DNA polymerase-1